MFGREVGWGIGDQIDVTVERECFGQMDGMMLCDGREDASLLQLVEIGGF